MTVTVVTRANFATLLPSILHHIKCAEFITIDAEMTGLTTGPNSKYRPYDEIQERYRKLRDSASNFGMLQLGIAAFNYDTKNNRYEYTAWSFHLFPTVGDASTDYRKWTMQLSSMSFLRDNGFDFNKTFRDGISYLSVKEEADARNKYSPTPKASDKDIQMKDEDVEFVNSTIVSIKEWRENNENGEVELILPSCNAYKRRLLYENLPKQFGEDLVLKRHTGENREASLKLSFLNREQRDALSVEDTSKFEKELIEKVGIRRVWDMIVREGKPIVGHNCWLDLCHIYHKFIGPLPNDFDAFVEGLKENGVGAIFDTKFMCNQLMKEGLLKELNSTSLSDLTAAVNDPSVWGLKIKVHGGSSKKGEAKFHDAGYDAYCTGKVFIGAVSLISAKFNEGKLHDCMSVFLKGIPEENPASPLDLDYLKSFSNKIFMMQSDYDSHGVVLSLSSWCTPQSHPDRSSLFVITGLTADMSNVDVEVALVAFGCEKGALRMFWIDGQMLYFSCEGFVIPSDTPHVVVPVLQKGNPAELIVRPYEAVKKERETSPNITPPKRMRSQN